MSTEPTKLKNGPCDCCGEPGGAGNCCIATFVPCYGLYKTAENIGDDNGVIYCIGALFGEYTVVPSLFVFVSFRLFSFLILYLF